MDGQAVEQIASLAKNNIVVEIDGMKYSPLNLKRVIHDPLPDTLKACTLGAVADFVKSLGLPAIITVDSPGSVSVFSELNQETMSRRRYLVSSLCEDSRFPFGQFLTNEDFIIQLKSRFIETNDQREILSFASKITAGNTLSTQDDGVSQSVEIKKGISGALRVAQTAPSVVSLKPFRTFREITQPESFFIFRMRGNSDQLPSCALFEADGGAWKISAISEIALWLRQNVPGVTVIS